MLKYNVSALVLSSLHSETFNDKCASYEEKLQKERERVSDLRDLKDEARRRNNYRDKLIDRRDAMDKARELRASVCKEV